MDHIPPKERKCHHAGFAKGCRTLVNSGACAKWTNLQGEHPQTGEKLNKWGCNEDFTHLLLIEVARKAHEGAAATLDFRNAVLDREVRARQVAQLENETRQIEVQ